MGPVDPTYPLYPVALVLASLMLLLVLTTTFVRQNRNLGVTFLCFWLSIECLAEAVNAIVWHDNADVKLYVYCDIVSHIQMISYIVKPMSTLIITRRLYLIASLHSVQLSSTSERRRDSAIEWTLGLGVPLLVAGPIYYVNQGIRFSIMEGLGCSSSYTTSILELLTLESWTIIPPLISIICYYPRVAKLCYDHRKDFDSCLRSNPSISRTNYNRILALASIDILLTLPISILNITLNVVYALTPPAYLPFYPGWNFLHTDWEPLSYSYRDQEAFGVEYVAQTYISIWSSPTLAFAIFGLFGLTSEARGSYWRIIRTVGGCFGWTHTEPRTRTGRASLGEIKFGARPRHTGTSSGFDLEMGSHPPSLVNADATVARLDAMEDGSGGGSRSTTDLN